MSAAGEVQVASTATSEGVVQASRPRAVMDRLGVMRGRLDVSTGALAVWAALAWAGLALYMNLWGRDWDADLRVYRDGAHVFLSGRTPYSAAFDAHHLPYTYPPFSLLVFAPLAAGPLSVVKVIWWAFNAAATCGVVLLALRAATGLRSFRALAVAALVGAIASAVLEPVRSNMDYGQINVVLMLLVVIDVLRPPGRGRGALVGLAAAVKLTPLVFLAYFVLSRDWRSLARGAAAFCAAALAGWAAMPVASMRYWTRLVFDPAQAGQSGFVANQSWDGLLHRPLFSWGAAGPALFSALVVVTTAAALLLAWRLVLRGRTLGALVALALGGLLASPVSWTHHWSWILLLPVVLLGRERPHGYVAAAMVALLLCAAAGLYWLAVPGWLAPLTTSSLVLAGAALLFGWAAVEARSWSIEAHARVRPA